MLKLSRTLLSGVLILGLASVGYAQLLTANTMSTVAVDNSNGHNLNSGQAYTQTFTGIDSIDTLTLRFISSLNTPDVIAPIDVYFSEWSGSAATSLIEGGTLNLASRSTWTLDGANYYLDASMDLSSIATGLNPSLTYGFTIVGPTSPLFLVGYTANDLVYAGGGIFVKNGVTDFSDLTGTNSLGKDFAFIADSSAAAYTPFSVTPVPEASTIAVLFAGIFVGGMVFKRVRDRRLQAAAAAVA